MKKAKRILGNYVVMLKNCAHDLYPLMLKMVMVVTIIISVVIMFNVRIGELSLMEILGAFIVAAFTCSVVCILLWTIMGIAILTAGFIIFIIYDFISGKKDKAA